MRTLLPALFVLDLLLGAWIAWGDPQDGAHEPGRLERQVQPARLRLIGDEEMQRARQRSQEFAAESAAATAASNASGRGAAGASPAASAEGAAAKSRGSPSKK